ncbi:hypothetical protein L0F63_004196 [Massospora cicadina]|nr:hypothetical protein L0F63_004196 [Massospora cicadina]
MSLLSFYVVAVQVTLAGATSRLAGAIDELIPTLAETIFASSIGNSQSFGNEAKQRATVPTEANGS